MICSSGFLGAVSIARRLVDPLSEIVKIPPEAMGIGMYQHDLAKSDLASHLSEVIEECVNSGGIDINRCGEYLLMYVAGLNHSRAKAIVDHRDENGYFASISEMKNVKGIGAISFRNAAGFLRVYGGNEALDSTAVHPEHYSILRSIIDWSQEQQSCVEPAMKKQKLTSSKACSSRRCAIEIDHTMIKNGEISKLLDFAISNHNTIPSHIIESYKKTLGTENIGTWQNVDIIESFKDTIHDWKKWLSTAHDNAEIGIPWASDIPAGVPPILRSKSTNSGDRNNATGSAGQTLLGVPIDGVVKNAVPFGVFVDVGASRDGLLHRSKFSFDHLSRPGIPKLDDIVVGQRLRVMIIRKNPSDKLELDFCDEKGK